MAITAEKKNRVAEMKEKLSQGKGIVLADYRGISVALDTKLRRQMREAGVEYRVAKNAFTRIAAEELGISGLDEHLTGPVAIAISYEDAVAPAKVLAGFSKENKVLKLKAGILFWGSECAGGASIQRSIACKTYGQHERTNQWLRKCTSWEFTRIGLCT